MGEYWFTTLSAVRRNEPDWVAIAAYEAPIRRFLATAFRTIPEGDRDDLVQEILIAMHERVVEGYDPDRGRFRPFLRTAIRNRVRDYFRKRRPSVPVDEVPLFEEDEVPDALETIDLEAVVVRAVRGFHDRRVAAGDLEAVYVFSGILVDGLTQKDVGKREGLSRDQVKRILRDARAEIWRNVFGALLDEEPSESVTDRAAELARRCLRAPRRMERLLEEESEPEVREAVREFVTGLLDARNQLTPAGEVSESSGDLRRGLEFLFSE